MRSQWRFFPLFIFILIISCSKNEFVLTFDLPDDLSVNYDLTYYATSETGGVTVQTVASVQHGKCRLDGLTKLPTLIYLTEKSRDIPLVIYAEPGNNIEISGDGNAPLQWQVVGNQINETLSQWRHEYADTLKNKKPLEINSAVADFIRKNPSDPAATIILFSYYYRSLDETEYASLMAYLRGDARKESWIAMIGRTDQMQMSVSYPARLQSMVMKSAFNNSDTIRPDSTKAIFMFFWQHGDNDRKEYLDSMKVLRKEFPDSSLYFLADVSLDADSSSWRSPLRRDSVKEMARLWVSAGLADENVMKLKVPSIPYIIVFDSLGIQCYRGKDIKDAMDEFRKISSLPDSLKK